MVTQNWFVTATEARNNIVKDIAVHGEISALEHEIMLAVQRGDYEVTVAGDSPFTTLPSTGAQIFVVDPVTNQLYVPGHGFATGDLVTVSATVQLPPPLKPLTYYHVIYVDDNNIKLAVTNADARAGRSMSIDIDQGVSTVTVTESGSRYEITPQVTFVGGTPETAAQAVAFLKTDGVLERVQVTDGGAYFGRNPSVQVISPGSGAQVGQIRLKVVSVSVSFGGTGYNVNDLLTLATGAGAPACVVRVTDIDAGSVTAVSLVNGGSYVSTLLPNINNSITLSSGLGGGCTLNLSLGVLSMSLISGGLNYVVPPLVTISNGGGTGAQARAILTAGVITQIQVTQPGSAYTDTPTVSITAGSGAQVVSSLTPTGLQQIDVTVNANYNTQPNVSITTPGTGAQAGTVSMKVTQVSVRNSGVGYVQGDQLLVSGGTASLGAALQVTQVNAVGAILTMQILEGGSYSTLPSSLANQLYGGSGHDAQVDILWGVRSVSVQSTGTAYTVPPLVLFTETVSDPAQAVCDLVTGSVSAIRILNTGSGYSQIPTVSLTCGSGATAQVNLVPTGVNATILVVDGGSGYTEPPPVTISGGGGTGATAEAVLSGDSIVSITLTNPGSGYTNSPNISVPGNAQLLAQLQTTTIQSISVIGPGENYITNPIITIEGAAQAEGILLPTSVQRVHVINSGTNYTANPILSWQLDPLEPNEPTLPLTQTIRSFGLNSITVTSAGSDYQSEPDVQLSAPQPGGVQATAVANLGEGQGVFQISAYQSSLDYWKVNCGTDPSSTLLMRPYKDRIASVTKYFTDLGYSVVLDTNPVTGRTLRWIIKW